VVIRIVKDSYVGHPEIRDFCVDLRTRGVINPHLLSTLADIYIEENRKGEAAEVGFLFFCYCLKTDFSSSLFLAPFSTPIAL